MAWSSAAYLNDFGIGNPAAALAAKPAMDDPCAGHYADDAAYFRNRALDCVNLFAPAVGFFVGRDGAGYWRYDKADFEPLRWGGDSTETAVWNMAFDPVQDGAGLADLYGGRGGAAAKLDAFFSTPGNFPVEGTG